MEKKSNKTTKETTDWRPTDTTTDTERRMAEEELLKAHGSRRPMERSPNRKADAHRTSSLPDRVEGQIYEKKSEKRPAEGDVTSPGNRETMKKTKGQQGSESESEAEDETQEEMETEDTRKEFAHEFKESLKSLFNWQQVNIKSKVISKRQSDKFTELLQRIERAFTECEKENSFLRGRIEERREIMALIASRPVEGKTFAQAARQEPRQDYPRLPKITGIRTGAVKKQGEQVYITKTGKDSEEVRSEMKKILDPRGLGLNVRKVIKARGGVMVEVGSAEEAGKILNSQQLKDNGMTATKPKALKPIIMIYDVEKGKKDERMLEIFEKNLEGKGLTNQEFKAEFSVKHVFENRRRGRGEQTRRDGEETTKENWVVECSGRVRNLLRERDKIYIGWECCRVKDYVDVARCYKCQRYGHVAKVCLNKEVCSFCAGEHKFADCKAKDDQVQCVNCHTNRDNSYHAATWKNCPTYKRQVERYFSRIDYGI